MISLSPADIVNIVSSGHVEYQRQSCMLYRCNSNPAAIILFLSLSSKSS